MPLQCVAGVAGPQRRQGAVHPVPRSATGCQLSDYLSEVAYLSRHRQTETAEAKRDSNTICKKLG